jgi:Peptidase S24-like
MDSHELFYSARSSLARLAAVAQILNKPGIARREAAKFCARHAGLAQEAFDPGDEHAILLRFWFRIRIGCDVLSLFKLKSYLSRKNTSGIANLMGTVDPRGKLLALAARRGVSLRALSDMIGRNSTYLRQFVSKGSPRKLAENDRRILARFFGVDEAELGGLGDNDPSGAQRTPGEWVNIPRLPVNASAGPGATAQDERAIGAFGFSRRWLREQGLDPQALSSIRVEGDSMEPTLREGDEILVDRSPRPLRDGIHVVRTGDALLVKRLVTGRPGLVTLVSDNPAYPAFELAAGQLVVVGRVVWKSGRL